MKITYRQISLRSNHENDRTPYCVLASSVSITGTHICKLRQASTAAMSANTGSFCDKNLFTEWKQKAPLPRRAQRVRRA